MHTLRGSGWAAGYYKYYQQRMTFMFMLEIHGNLHRGTEDSPDDWELASSDEPVRSHHVWTRESIFGEPVSVLPLTLVQGMWCPWPLCRTTPDLLKKISLSSCVQSRWFQLLHIADVFPPIDDLWHQLYAAAETWYWLSPNAPWQQQEIDKKMEDIT